MECVRFFRFMLSDTPKNPGAFSLTQRLKRLPELRELPEKELLDAISLQSQPAIHAKQKLLACLFQKNGVNKLKEMMDTRKLERKTEVRDNIPVAGRKAHDRLFNELFLKTTEQILVEKFEFVSSHKKSLNVLENKADFIQSLAFLLDKIQVCNMPSTKSMASKVSKDESHLRRKHSKQEISPIRKTFPSKPSTATSIKEVGLSDLISPVSVVSSEKLKAINKLHGKPTQSYSTDPSTEKSKKAFHTDDIEHAKVIQKQRPITHLNNERIAELEHQIKQLKSENHTLTTKYTNLQSLIHETISPKLPVTAEKLDHKRCFLLKSKLAQMYRRTDALRTSMLEMEYSMDVACGDIRGVCDGLRQVIPKIECKSSIVFLKKSVQTLNSTVMKINSKPRDRLDDDPVDDILEEKNMFDMTRLSTLETQLHELYGLFVEVRECIKSCLVPFVCDEFRDKVDETVSKSLNKLNKVNDTLITLSVLTPGAMDTRKSNAKENLAQKEVAAYKEVIDIENQKLKNQVGFHVDVYEKYNASISSLVEQFEFRNREINELLQGIKDPLTGIKQRMQFLSDNYNTENVLRFIEFVEKEVDQVIK